MREDLSPSVAYVRTLYAPEDALLARIRENTPAAIARMQIGPDEGKLLQMLIRLHGVRTVVEIGTLLGYSAVWMARALPPDGHLHTINNDAEQVKAAMRHFAEYAKNPSPLGGEGRGGDSTPTLPITQHQGDAIEVLETLSGPFDMAFIDADKLNYPHYLDWAEKNIRAGGLIVADNTFLFGTVWQEKPPAGGDRPTPSAWRAMREFNQRLADPQRYHATILPTREGMSVAIKRF